MRDRRFDQALEAGRAVRDAASKVRGAWWPGWRQQQLHTALGAFIRALQSVPQDEAASLSRDDIAALLQTVDAAINDAEASMAGHSTRAQLERDREIVNQIYQLREDVESLARRVTADPAMLDLKWKVKTHPHMTRRL